MEFINIFLLPLTFLIVAITSLLSLICGIGTLFQKIIFKSTDIYKYHISNMYFTGFCISIYILFFIVFLYGLRIYNINHVVDLHKIYTNLEKLTLLTAALSSWMTVMFLVIFILNILIFMLLILIIIQKYFLHQIFILFLFFTYDGNRSAKYERFIDNLGWIGTNDLISYGMNRISFKITYYFDEDYDYAKLPWYHHYKIISTIFNLKYFPMLFPFTPFIVIFYDCIFNDLIITHVFYYLLIYIPIMILKRITNSLAHNGDYISKLFWNMYYKKETCIYAINAENYEILKYFLLAELRSNIDTLDTEFYLNGLLNFERDPYELNVIGYRNAEGKFLERTPDNRLLREIMTDDGGDKIEEWIFLLEKTGNKTIMYKRFL